jgi:3-isopropylmalate dehydrogenase
LSLILSPIIYLERFATKKCMTSRKIALIMGDGIGKEVIPEGKKTMVTISNHSDFDFEFLNISAGGEVWKKRGQSITDASLTELKTVDSVLLGALGIPGLPQGVAEYAVLKIRQEFNQYVNLRPIKLYDSLRDCCPLKEEYIGSGIDMSIIRENSEGIYSKIGGSLQDRASVDTMVFTQTGVRRILQFAYKFAEKQKHTVISSVDKANLLHTSQLWRSIFEDEGKKHPNLKQESYYIDAFCQWLIRAPYKFQTVVTSNLFGDIISDEGAYLVGSLGMGASGNINPEPGGISMFEPIHGSAPDIAGKNIANPIATILSIKLMFEYVFDDTNMGRLIDNAIEKAIETNRTPDIFPIRDNTNLKKVTTQEMGSCIRAELTKLLKK